MDEQTEHQRKLKNMWTGHTTSLLSSHTSEGENMIMKHSRKTVRIRKHAVAFRETRTFHQAELQAIARGLKKLCRYFTTSQSCLHQFYWAS
jgi:hypothetical protein